MKHLKKFDNLNYSTINPFLEEMNINNKIVDFIKKHDLEYVDNIKIYGKKYYIKHLKYSNYDKLLKYKNEGDEPEEIMIGIPRNKGVYIYDRILKQLEKLSEKDIELLKLKQASKKYNL